MLFFFVVCGILAAGYGIRLLRRALRYCHLPATEATVLTSGVASGEPAIDSGISYFPYASFTYSVAGHHYTSKRLYSFGHLGASKLLRRSAERAVAGLDVGSTIRVSYDPDEPSFAFIHNGPWLQVCVPLVSGTLFCALALWWHLKA